MHSLDASRQSYYDFHDLSKEGEDTVRENDVQKYFKIPSCPRLLVCLFSIPVQSLLDTGSQVTAMAESFYNNLKAYNQLNEFPVSNIMILTAIGKKATNIKKQILCNVCVGEISYPTSFLIVPNLSNSIILGNDWFLKNKVLLDYQQFSVVIQNTVVNSCFVSYDQSSREKVIADRVEDITYLQVINYENNNKIIYNRDVEGFQGDTFADKNKLKEAIEIYDSKENNSPLNVCDKLSNFIQVKNNVDDSGKTLICEKPNGDDRFDIEVMDDHRTIVELDAVESVINDHLSDRESFRSDLQMIASEFEGISYEEKEFFVNEMMKFEKLFRAKNSSAFTPPYKMKIKPHKTIVRKSYPVPFVHRDSVREEISKMLESGIIERSDSNYCNPLRIVIKSNKSVRICLDARYINEIIESDHEAPPLIGELMQKFYGTTYMSTADLTAGYWQIPLDESSRKYTAFLFDSKLYQFCRIPFGIKTAGSAFIRALNGAIGNRFPNLLTTYIDDFFGYHTRIIL